MSEFRSKVLPEPAGEYDGLSAEVREMMEANAGMGVSTDVREAEEGEDVDPVDGPAFGPTFLEKLLIVIIDAHRVDGKTRRQRLDAAMRALTGNKSSGNAFLDDLDDRALLWMKSAQIRRKALGSNLRTSDRALAIEAAANFLAVYDRDAAANRLREKFSGAYDRKQDKGRQIDVPGTLAYRVTQHDYTAESVEAQMLRHVVTILRNARVPVLLSD